MANRITVKLEGEQELIDKLKRMGAGAERVLRGAVEAGAEIVRDDSSRQAPGPHVERETRRASPGRVEVAVGPDKPHWYYKFAETGAIPHTITGSPRLAFPAGGRMIVVSAVHHPGMGARPFLRPALDKNRQEVVDTVGRLVRALVERETAG